ncbi:Dyp-type peroxidase [Gautieria morchelliformis]|nr:Dyp-type peroxidase [Gautieria morchelliformis]
MSTPTLDLTNIQGDILQGLPKRVQSFIFFTITNPTEFRQRLKAIIPLITTTTQVLADEAAIAAHKESGAGGLLTLTGTNIAFSSKGLIALGVADQLGDDIFTRGQLDDARKSSADGGIADPGTPVDGGGIDPAWDPLFKKTIHGVFNVTGDSKLTITARITVIESILATAINILGQVDGNVRPGNEAGHEHFGFQDGLSQPPIIGFRSPNKGEIATNPGIILLGEGGDIVSRPPWAKDSSFLAFRKLKQLVPEFNDFLTRNPILNGGSTPAEGSELLGARLVGRWKSGAPIDRDPIHDNPVDAGDVNKVNDFDYSDDPNQIRCPFASHLRKTNPRNSAFPGLVNVQFSRIIRQGIPYGPEVTQAESSLATTQHDRGLLFASYQSNLAKGFHFVQRTWSNNPGFPPPVGTLPVNGFDPIIGQQANDARFITGTNPEKLTESLALPKLFVVPRGGEYFIVPSISALKGTFSS